MAPGWKHHTDVDMGTNQIHNVVDPTSAQDAATKKYVDDTIGGGTVTSISKSGSALLTGDVTLTGGTGISLTQTGQDISIAASGSGITFGTANSGTYLDVTTTNVDGDGYGVHIHDTNAGSSGVFIESDNGDVGMVAGNAAYIKSGDSSVEAAATAVRVDLDTGATFTIYDSDGSTVLAEWTAS